MGRDVDVQVVDGEVRITKLRDTPEADGTIAAVKRIVDLFNIALNDSEYTPGAYGEDVDPDGETGEGDDDESEPEREARERRERRRLVANEQTAAAGREVAATSKKETTMPSLDDALSTVAKSGLTFQTLERFCKADRGELDEHTITALLLETPGWGVANFAKRLTGSDREGCIAREALTLAKRRAWGLPA